MSKQIKRKILGGFDVLDGTLDAVIEYLNSFRQEINFEKFKGCNPMIIIEPVYNYDSVWQQVIFDRLETDEEYEKRKRSESLRRENKKKMERKADEKLAKKLLRKYGKDIFEDES